MNHNKSIWLTVFISLFMLISQGCGGGSKKSERDSNDQYTLTQEQTQKGNALYRSKCMNCHMPKGEGINGIYPPLAGSDFLRKNIVRSLGIVKYGSSSPIKVNGIRYQGVMPAAGISDEDLVILFNYVLNSWGNSYGSVSLEDVKRVEKL